MTWETISLDVCDSCVQFVANGELPYDSKTRNTKFLARMEKAWPSEETTEGDGIERVYLSGWQLIASCSNPSCPKTEEGWTYCEASFSFADCEACGREGGGHRHHATAMREIRTYLEKLSLVEKKEQS